MLWQTIGRQEGVGGGVEEMASLFGALKYLGPLALVVWIVYHTYTKLIPELMSGFRAELQAFRDELGAERASREKMLKDERKAREEFTEELRLMRGALPVCHLPCPPADV